MKCFPFRTRWAFLLTLLPALVAVGCDGGDGGKGASAASSAAPGGPLTEDAVKQFITRKEENLATGVGSAHKSVTVEFVEIRMGATRAPNEQDKIDGVRGDTVYPVRAKFKSKRVWGNGETEEKLIHYAYDFYRDESGEWNALLLGPVN